MGSQSSSVDSVPTGQQKPSSSAGVFNQVEFMVQRMLNQIQTSTLVRIETCTNDGELSPVGFVDVTPLVNQIDGQGVATPHATIFNVPYFRIQGGKNAVVMDPQPGDIGMCAFASRDLSKIKATKTQGNPGSFRQFSFSDGLYLGGFLNGTPTQYVQFSAAGIKVYSPTLVQIEAPDVQLTAATVEIVASTSVVVTTPLFVVNGATRLNGPISQVGGGSSAFSGDVDVPDGDVTVAGVSVHNHTHPITPPGSGETDPPNPS